MLKFCLTINNLNFEKLSCVVATRLNNVLYGKMKNGYIHMDDELGKSSLMMIYFGLKRGIFFRVDKLPIFGVCVPLS